MEKKYLLALDVGTSSCKVTIFDSEGLVRGDWSGSYPTYYPYESWVEQNPEDWWKQLCEGIGHVLNQSKIDPREIVAIGVDGTSWALIAIDKQGRLLHPAMLWLDRRAEEQANYMKDELGEDRIIDISGNPVDPAYLTPKMLWLRENKKEIYRDTYKFLQSNSYIIYRLTGKISQDYSQAYGFHFYNIGESRWEESIAEKLGISLDLMAPLYNSHEIVSSLTEEAARETGLIKGIPVVAGGLDAATSSLGAGVIGLGQTQEQGGQAGGMSIALDRPLIHPKLILGYHVVPNHWLLQGGSVGGSGTLRWFKDELGHYEVDLARERSVSPYSIMDQEAEKIRLASDGLIFLPYMAGERSPIWDSNARGLLLGLSYNKTRGHIIRAIMEGVGFSLLHNLETAKEVDANVDILKSVGGAANSRVWTQIKSDITGKIIEVPYSDHATALGSAILAGVGTGFYKDFDEAVSRAVKIKRVHYPNNENTKVYWDYYKLYLKIYESLKDIFKDLADLNQNDINGRK